jgi:hypothetical protein
MARAICLIRTGAECYHMIESGRSARTRPMVKVRCRGHAALKLSSPGCEASMVTFFTGATAAVTTVAQNGQPAQETTRYGERAVLKKTLHLSSEGQLAQRAVVQVLKVQRISAALPTVNVRCTGAAVV